MELGLTLESRALGMTTRNYREFRLEPDDAYASASLAEHEEWGRHTIEVAAS